MYFDFEDHRPDTPTIPRPMSPREVVLITVNLHLVFLVVVLLGPRLPFVQKLIEQQQQAQAELQRQELQRQKEQARFVFVQPRVERPAPPRERADLSDLDRRARTERPSDPKNDLPFARGNTIERVDSQPEMTASSPSPAPEPSPAPPQPQASAVPLPQADNGYSRPQETQQRPSGSVGVLADAIRNVQRYAQNERFGNLQGGRNQDFDSGFDFDTKGVDFGWWLSRFKAQVRRNWLPLIPQAVMTMHGRVAITFYVHKDGRITDVSVLRPSPVDGFTLAARGAILTSNPTLPLPPEYPDDRAFFTVTFFYNEYPDAP